jgi:hypothetical protein
VDFSAIRERVKSLQQETAELRTASVAYLNKHLHSALEIHAQRQRELRLQQIVDELGSLTKTKIR